MTSTFRPRHLSASSVALYTRCPAQYHRRYVERAPDPDSVPQAFGKAFHKALEMLHRGDDAELAWIAAWNAADAACASRGMALTPGKAHGLALLDLYRERGLDAVRGDPERKFELHLPTSNVPVPILGFIDLAVPEAREFRDFKTTGGSWWTQTKVDMEHQLHLYGWAYQRLYRHRPSVARWCVFNTLTPTLDVYEAYPSPDGLRLFELQAEAAWKGITSGRFDGCGEAKCPVCAPPIAPRPAGPTLSLEGVR